MKFSCGETREAKKARLKEWHPFFALFPRTVAINGDRYECRWLETIERKGEYLMGWDGGYWFWEYRARSGE